MDRHRGLGCYPRAVTVALHWRLTRSWNSRNCVYGSERTSERPMLRRSCKAPRRLKTPIISQPAGEIGIFTILSAMTYSKGKMPQTEEEHWLAVTQEPSELAAISR